MGKRQPTERSALLGDNGSQCAAVSLHDAAEASPSPHHEEHERESAHTLARHFRRGMKRYKREIALVAVAVAVVAAVLAFALFRSEVAAPTPAVVGKIDEEEFDAIVIGGGPAGSVISKLLSDDPWRKVLLIEAGDTSQVELGGKEFIRGGFLAIGAHVSSSMANAMQAAVASALNVQGLTPFDMPFYWTNVANTARLHWDYPGVNVAKALGGCGIHNAMLYVRALPRDMDRWAMANWTWAKALEIYLQMEDYDGPNSSYHGTQGFVRTSGPGVRDQLSEEFVQACEQVGIPRTADFNAPGGRFGTGYYHFNTRDGIRESAARTFLGPLLQGHEQSQQSNFRILLNTMVSKIVISDASEARGVEIIRSDGTLQIIQLSKRGQVIVTAGAINTPKVLLMSGVGDEAALQRLNITVKKHLPRVGMNLQDHPVLGVTFDSLDPLAFDLQSELEHYFKAKHANATNASSYGVMGSAGISAGAFLIPPGSTIPEIQLTFFPRKSEPHISNSSDLNHTAEILFTVALLTPRARNRVVLVPRSNESNAELIPRVVSEVPEVEAEEHLRGDDVWKLSWGVSVVREIASVLAKRGLTGREISPGAEIREPGDLNAWVLGAVFRNSHWVGSASMADSEEEGVVDNHLRVFGVKNLRVADASVIPAIPNGNVHSSVLMVASHAAELIRADDQPVEK